MKRMAAFCLFLALCLCASGALAQLGFAEVAKDSVNLRKSPGGDQIIVSKIACTKFYIIFK